MFADGDVWITPIVLFTLAWSWMMSAVGDGGRDRGVRLRVFVAWVVGLSAFFLFLYWDCSRGLC